MEVEEGVDALSVLGEHLVNTILAHEPIEMIKSIIDNGAPLWYQNAEEGMSPLHAAAYMQNTELAKLLIEQGAIWNAVDKLKNTAGDIALSFNDAETYILIRDAGIRAELLLSLLSSKTSLDTASTMVLRENDPTAVGSPEEFLSSNLKFTKDKHGQDVCLLKVGEEEIGVMMGWERGIMEKTVERLCNNHGNSHGLKILNIGFGLGIIDSLFQSLPMPPSQHIIIEPHPDVLRYMKERGWYEKPSVKILEGKWQDYIDKDYGDLHAFFEHLPDLLRDPGSRFSFFNGLGATNALFYDVYTHIAELHLSDVGIDVEWSDVDVAFDTVEDRWGNSRKYFTSPLYRLPVGKMAAVL